MKYELKIWRIGSTVISILGFFSFLSPTQAQLNQPRFFRDGFEQMQQEIRRLENQQQQQSPEHPSQLLTVDEGQLRWQKFIFSDAGFSVWMPGGVQNAQTYTLETTFGKLPFDIVATQPSFGQFIAAYSENLDSSQLSDSQSLLSSIRDGIVQETQFQLIEDQDISFEQYPGKQLILTDEDEMFTFRVYIANQRVYILAARRSNNQDLSAELNNFFDSFRLLK